MRPSFLFLIACVAVLPFQTSRADSFRQSVGKGNWATSVSYEWSEIDNRLTKSTAANVSSWNQEYTAPVKRKTVMLRGAYGVLDQMDVFAGVGFVDERWNARRRDNGNNDIEQTGEDPVFEVGIKGTALEFMGDKIYLAYLLKYSYLDIGDKYESSVGADTNDVEVTWKQYDLDIEVGYRFKDIGLTSYAGVGYSDIEAKQRVDTVRHEYENEDDFSFILGLNKNINENISLNVEGTLAAKESVQIGFNYKF